MRRQAAQLLYVPDSQIWLTKSWVGKGATSQWKYWPVGKKQICEIVNFKAKHEEPNETKPSVSWGLDSSRGLTWIWYIWKASFNKLNEDNEVEKEWNISNFIPSASFSPQTYLLISYSCYNLGITGKVMRYCRLVLLLYVYSWSEIWQW